MKYYQNLSEAVSATDPRWERPFLCHQHDDHNASASVNVQKGLWYCYTCKAKGTLDGMEIEEELNIRYIDDLLAEPKIYSESWLDLYCAGPIHPYWLSRYSEDACRHFQLGYDPETNRPCYPLRGTHGDIYGIVTRCLDDSGPKYKYPSGIKIHNLLFNYQPAERDVVILVEGAMDVVACWEVGFDAFGLFGSSLSDGQVRLLRALGPDKVVFAFDNDHAGRKCTELADERLRGVCDTVALDWGRYTQGDDVAELPKDLRMQALSELAL